MSDDSEETLFERVLKESLDLGYSTEVATAIANACVREGSDASARLAGVAARYDAKHLVPQFLDLGLAFNEGKQMLQQAACGARHLDIYAMQRMRCLLQQKAAR